MKNLRDCVMTYPAATSVFSTFTSGTTNQATQAAGGNSTVTPCAEIHDGHP